METKKKRLNPSIFEEEVAVAAFDQTESGTVKPKSDTDSAPKDLEFTIEEGYHALERKFEDLVLEVYGSEIQVFYHESYSPVEVKERKEYHTGSTWILCLVDIKKRRIFPNKKTPRTQVRIQKDVENGYAQIYGSEGSPKYNPIAIRAYNQDALDKAKIFAQKYKEMSGQKVRLIQEF